MDFVTLGHILFGTATYQHGNVKLVARAGGARGDGAVYEFGVSGASVVVTVTLTAAGVGKVTVTAPASATEAQLVQALRVAPGFFQLFSVSLSGNGSALVAATVTKGTINDGLLQHLQTRLPLPGENNGVAVPWGDRDMLATERPVGLLWPASARFVRFSPESDGIDEYEGVVMIGLGLSLKADSFHTQNQVLEYYRRKLGMALKIFKHDGLTGLGPVEWSNTNTEKDEVSGTPLEQARVRVVFSCAIKWSEPSRDDEDTIFAEMQPPQIALWREPIDDPLGGGGTGGEVLDTVLTITEE